MDNEMSLQLPITSKESNWYSLLKFDCFESTNKEIKCNQDQNNRQQFYQEMSGYKNLGNNVLPVVKLERLHLRNGTLGPQLQHNQVTREHLQVNIVKNCNINTQKENVEMKYQLNTTSSVSRRTEPYSRKRIYPFGKENENKLIKCNMNIQKEYRKTEYQFTFGFSSISRQKEPSSSITYPIGKKNEGNPLYCKTCKKSIAVGTIPGLVERFSTVPKAISNHTCEPVLIKDCVVELKRLKVMPDRPNKRHKRKQKSAKPVKYIDDNQHENSSEQNENGFKRLLTDEEVWEGIKGLSSPDILVLPPSVCLKVAHSAKEDVLNLLADENFNKKIILAPISNAVKDEKSGFNTEGSHWSLVVINVTDRQYYHLDSVPGLNKDCALQFSESINALLKFSPFKFIVRKCDKQNDEFSCGKEVIKNAKEQVNLLLRCKTAPETSLRREVKALESGRLDYPRVVLENISARVNKQLLNLSVNLSLTVPLIPDIVRANLVMNNTEQKMSYEINVLNYRDVAGNQYYRD